MTSYNVSYHSLNYRRTKPSWKEIEKIMQHGFWILFGENDLDGNVLGFIFNSQVCVWGYFPILYISIIEPPLATVVAFFTTFSKETLHCKTTVSLSCL